MSCPYAAPLSKDEDADASSVGTTSPKNGPLSASSGDKEVKEALALARSACPAFQDGKGCPFRDATDAEAMRLAMLKVPSSHIGVIGESRGASAQPPSGSDTAAMFQKALEHVHTVSTTLHSPTASTTTAGADSSSARTESPFGGFMLDGGCPFKTFYKGKGDNAAPVPFVSALEELSLSAIIAKMADDEEATMDADVAAAAEKLAPPSSVADSTSSVPTAGPDAAAAAAAAASTDSERLSISAALQTGTAESHEAAESVHFVKNFVKGIIDRDLYATLVVSLYHVYNVMEQELDRHGPTHFPALHHPIELNRTESLDDDAEFFHGMGWQNTAIGGQSLATRDYVDRLRFISETEPLLLLSHAYTRYLGDLSGGRILARIARRALNLKGSKDGLRFYEFELIDNAKKFKDQYRRALDDLKLSTDQVDRLVAEANVAFVLNMRVFEELDVKGGVQGAQVRPLSEATKYYDRCVTDQKQGRRGSASVPAGSSQCPFAYLGGPNPHASAEAPTEKVAATPVSTTEATKELSRSHEKSGRCPWPFVFFHDPTQGLKDWQTWVVVGLALSLIWSKVQA